MTWRHISAPAKSQQPWMRLESQSIGNLRPICCPSWTRYRLSDRVRSAVNQAPTGEIAKLIRDNPKLQLRRNHVERRRSIPGGNGRMRALLRDLAGSRLHRLLWLPPSLPAHRLGRDFERAKTATKRLVFSSWAMAPRAVAVMASYDAERRYVRERARAGRYRARLLPVRRDAYSLFALMAPSYTLAEAGDPASVRESECQGTPWRDPKGI